MKKVFFLLALTSFFLFLFSANVKAADTDTVSVSAEPIVNIVPAETVMPATFNVTLTNEAVISTKFEFYTLSDASLRPTETLDLPGYSEKSVNLTVYLGESLRQKLKGIYYPLTVYVKLPEKTVKLSLPIKVVSLGDVISVDLPTKISRTDKALNITFSLGEKLTLPVSFTVTSPLFSGQGSLTLTPFSTVSVPIALDPDTLSEKAAGNFSAKINVTVADYSFVREKSVTLSPFTEVKESKAETGVLLQKTVVSKVNTGNTPVTVTLSVERSAFAKIFTSFSTKPDSVEKTDTTFVFSWTRSLDPGESFTVTATTNFFLPLAVLVAIGVLVSLLLVIGGVQLTVKKTAVKVKTKTGEFALKISLSVLNKRGKASEVRLTDYLPALAKLHERWGIVKPHKVTEKSVEWLVPSMEAGEERIFTYIAYSRVGVVGRLELPRATVSYRDAKGKLRKSLSNRLVLLPTA